MLPIINTETSINEDRLENLTKAGDLLIKTGTQLLESKTITTISQQEINNLVTNTEKLINSGVKTYDVILKNEQNKIKIFNMKRSLGL